MNKTQPISRNSLKSSKRRNRFLKTQPLTQASKNLYRKSRPSSSEITQHAFEKVSFHSFKDTYFKQERPKTASGTPEYRRVVKVQNSSRIGPGYYNTSTIQKDSNIQIFCLTPRFNNSIQERLKCRLYLGYQSIVSRSVDISQKVAIVKRIQENKEKAVLSLKEKEAKRESNLQRRAIRAEINMYSSQRNFYQKQERYLEKIEQKEWKLAIRRNLEMARSVRELFYSVLATSGIG